MPYLRIDCKVILDILCYLSLIWFSLQSSITLSLTSWGPLKAVLGRFSSFTALSVDGFFGRLARGPKIVYYCLSTPIHIPQKSKEGIRKALHRRKAAPNVFAKLSVCIHTVQRNKLEKKKSLTWNIYEPPDEVVEETINVLL